MNGTNVEEKPSITADLSYTSANQYYEVLPFPTPLEQQCETESKSCFFSTTCSSSISPMLVNLIARHNYNFQHKVLRVD